MSANLRLLLVDDQPIVIAALRRMLQEPDLELHACTDATQIMEVAHAVRPTTILQDLVMPNVDGFDAVRAYREDPALAHVPVIVLSSKEDPRDKSHAFSVGASDYLVKMPDRVELLARVRAHSRSYLAQLERDAAYRELAALKIELEAKNAELECLSHVDGLTALANRRRFDHALEEELRRAQREGTCLSLVLGDVDFFKRYNDRYGHTGGDECLRQVASALRSCIRRGGDVAARYGGEEFALVLPNTYPTGAQTVAELVRERVAALGLVHESSDAAAHVTMSLGVSSAMPGTATTPRALIERADAALYEAKRAGRNRVAVASAVA